MIMRRAAGIARGLDGDEVVAPFAVGELMAAPAKALVVVVAGCRRHATDRPAHWRPACSRASAQIRKSRSASPVKPGSRRSLRCGERGLKNGPSVWRMVGSWLSLHSGVGGELLAGREIGQHQRQSGRGRRARYKKAPARLIVVSASFVSFNRIRIMSRPGCARSPEACRPARDRARPRSSPLRQVETPSVAKCWRRASRQRERPALSSLRSRHARLWSIRRGDR